MLVFLHGSGESGEGSEPSLPRVLEHGVPQLIRDDAWPDSRPFVVLAPQYGDAAAQACHLADAIDSFLEFALDRYDVDADRVYLTGISCGAIGAWDYLAAHGDGAVAAAVLIDGHAVDALADAGCDLGRVPVWAFHGELDSIVPKRYIVGPIGRLKACTDPAPEDVRLTLYPGVDHESWPRTYDLSAGHDVYAWLLQYERH